MERVQRKRIKEILVLKYEQYIYVINMWAVVGLYTLGQIKPLNKSNKSGT